MHYEDVLHKAPLKILSLLALYPGEDLFEKEICDKTDLAAGTVNQVMRTLVALGIVTVQAKGRMNFYRINEDLPFVRQHRIWSNLLMLQPLVQELKKYCSRIVLFGSSATGANTHKSDLDLFIISEEPAEKLRKIIDRYPEMSQTVKSLIYKISDFNAFIDQEPEFYKEVKKGVVLFEKGNMDESNL
jgi:predicted nucleotidyltransferase